MGPNVYSFHNSSTCRGASAFLRAVSAHEAIGFIPLEVINGTDGKGDFDDTTLKPDDIIIQLGGCGLFQILLSIIVQSMKTSVCWVMTGNAFFAFVPRWRCVAFDIPAGNLSHTHFTSYSGINNFTGNVNTSTAALENNVDETWVKQCFSGDARCVKFEYEAGMHTLVTEFDLVCDKAWVTATIISVQMSGMMLGSIVVGHIADIFGRKKPLFMSMCILFTFNLICYFAVNWIMFAVGRFFIGIGCAFFLSIYCVLQGEYTLSKWRSTAIGFPAWPLEICLFTLVAYIVHDWEILTLIMAFIALVYCLSWLYIPESFRWLVARDRTKEARATVNRIAHWNKRTVSEDKFVKMCQTVEKYHSEEGENYSAIVLFRKKSLLRLTIPLLVCWFSMGVMSYGINFGIKKLHGSFFLNMFLFAIAAIPSKVVALYLQVKFGRRPAGFVAFSICFIGGIVVGCLQYIDSDYRGSLTTYFALAASSGDQMSWGPIQTLTVELYPTVARNTAFASLSVFARLGAVLGPQFLYMEDFLPGLLYFVIAVLALLSIVSLAFLPETNHATLVDKVRDDIEKERRPENI